MTIGSMPMATVKNPATINAATQQYAMPQIEGFI